MVIDSSMASGMIGAMAVLVPLGGANIAAWSRARTEIGGMGARFNAEMESVKLRLQAVEAEADGLSEIRADVSYIRGVLDGEARAARDKAARPIRSTITQSL